MPMSRQWIEPSEYIMAWLAWMKAKTAMKSAKTGFITSRPISRRSGGTWPSTVRSPGWPAERTTSAAMQATMHQSAMPEPVRAISNPTPRLAARKPSEPMPRTGE